MSGVRLVVVTARYWPLVGETETFVAQLVEDLRPEVSETTVVTAHWSGSSPREVVHRETRAVRLRPAPVGGWSTYRHMRSLARWLRDRRRQIDVVYVMSLRQDAYAVLGALKDGPAAVVLRPQVGDVGWLETSRIGARMKPRLFGADAAVGCTRSLAAELAGSGFSQQRIRPIANGTRPAEPRSAANRHRARLALAAANHDLAVAEYAPVVVCAGPLREGRYWAELLAAWRHIADRWPSARLWITGDGPLREELYAHMVDAGLHHQVFLPGTFDELLDVFQAADVFVATAPDPNGGQWLLDAMATGLPVVAADSPDHRDLVQDGVNGLLFPPGDKAALAEALGTLLETPAATARLGEAARQAVERNHPAARTAAEHLNLFRQVLDDKRRNSG